MLTLMEVTYGSNFTQKYASSLWWPRKDIKNIVIMIVIKRKSLTH